MQNQSHKNSSLQASSIPLSASSTESPSTKGLSILVPIFRFLAPYKARVVAAMIALIFTAGMSLSIGQGLRLMIDDGFSANSPELG